MNEISEIVKERFNHQQNKQILKEKYEAKMLFASQGGMWKAGSELLTTILVCPDETAVILDEYDTPIQINTKKLYNEAQMHWQEQMNGWMFEYTLSNKQR